MVIFKENLFLVFMKYILILFVVLNSKTVYFGIIHNTLTQYTFIVLFIIGLFFIRISIRAIKINLTRFTLMLLYILINVFINFSGMGSSHFKIVIIFVINIILMSFICSQFTNFEIANVYVNLMSIIAIISLICFSLAIFSPDIPSKFATTYQAGSNGNYVLSPFYMWGWGRIATRNSGLFWEPGAFQAFIMVALLMTLLVLLPISQNMKNLKKLKAQFIIFCITILTTQSTTSYILFILLITVFYKDVKELFLTNSSKNGRLIKGFVTFIFISIGIYYVFASNNISDKFSGMGNEYSSVAIRMNDTIQSINLIKEGGFVGLGKTDNTKNMEVMNDINNNSNGIMNMLYTYGLFFGAIYIFFYKKGIDSFFIISKSRKKYFLYLVFIIFNFTEGFYWLSFFILFLFETKTYKFEYLKSKDIKIIGGDE